MREIALMLALAAGPADSVHEAERLAQAALAAAPAQAAASLDQARRALALTADFDPTVFVRAGRKGEVVEDEFQAARSDYRAHRALLYEAVGESLRRSGQALPAARYLRRAQLLGPSVPRARRLARALLEGGHAPEALAVLQSQVGIAGVDPELVALVEQAVDAAMLPSAQAELDRARLRLTNGVIVREGPLAMPAGTRLSTGAPLGLETAPLVVYSADPSCRSCSQEIEDLRRVSPAGTRVVIAAEPDRDHALRQVMALYKVEWPMVLGRGVPAALALKAGTVLVLGRGGWSNAVVPAPFDALPAVLQALSRSDVSEHPPRERWAQRTVDRRFAAPPALREDGVAPGEDEPAPPEFEAAVAALAAGRAAQAAEAFAALGARGDGWLLPPEARYDRGLALAAAGRHDEARRIFLKIGDSRFQDAVDKALEAPARR